MGAGKIKNSTYSQFFSSLSYVNENNSVEPEKGYKEAFVYLKVRKKYCRLSSSYSKHLLVWCNSSWGWGIKIEGPAAFTIWRFSAFKEDISWAVYNCPLFSHSIERSKRALLGIFLCVMNETLWFGVGKSLQCFCIEGLMQQDSNVEVWKMKSLITSMD